MDLEERLVSVRDELAGWLRQLRDLTGRSLREPHRMVRSLLPYAEACLATGDREAAARHFQAALELAAVHGLNDLVPGARAGLARAS